MRWRWRHARHWRSAHRWWRWRHAVVNKVEIVAVDNDNGTEGQPVVVDNAYACVGAVVGLIGRADAAVIVGLINGADVVGVAIRLRT